MRREVLLNVVRTEKGHLAIEFSRTNLYRYMPESFWKTLVQSLKQDQHYASSGKIKEGDTDKARQIIKIIEESLSGE